MTDYGDRKNRSPKSVNQNRSTKIGHGISDLKKIGQRNRSRQTQNRSPFKRSAAPSPGCAYLIPIELHFLPVLIKLVTVSFTCLPGALDFPTWPPGVLSGRSDRARNIPPLLPKAHVERVRACVLRRLGTNETIRILAP